MKLGISLKAYEKERLSLERILENVSRIGYEGVELRTCESQVPITITSNKVKKIRRNLVDFGLKAICLSTFTGDYSRLENKAECQKQLDEFKLFVEIAKGLDCDIVRHWAGWESSADTTMKRWERSVCWMKQAAVFAAKAGKKVGLEMHHSSLIDNVNSSLKYLADVDEESVILIHDAENFYHDQTDYGKEAIKKLGEYIREVHIKDTVILVDNSNSQANNYKGKWFCPRLIDEGGVDQCSVLAGLKEIGYNGYLTVESSCLLNNADELAKHEYRQMANLLRKLRIR